MVHSFREARKPHESFVWKKVIFDRKLSGYVGTSRKIREYCPFVLGWAKSTMFDTLRSGANTLEMSFAIWVRVNEEREGSSNSIENVCPPRSNVSPLTGQGVEMESREIAMSRFMAAVFLWEAWGDARCMRRGLNLDIDMVELGMWVCTLHCIRRGSHPTKWLSGKEPHR